MSRGLRAALGIQPGELLLLQPTRIVPRKRIERAIEISSADWDSRLRYSSHTCPAMKGRAMQITWPIRAARRGAGIFASDQVARTRRAVHGRAGDLLARRTPTSRPIWSPTRRPVEGFGNAFLETVYYQRPIMMADYEIFAVDIQPKGFRAITFGEFVGQDALDQARTWLANPALVAEVVSHNYEIARHHYSYRVLERHLALLLNECLGD